MQVFRVGLRCFCRCRPEWPRPGPGFRLGTAPQLQSIFGVLLRAIYNHSIYIYYPTVTEGGSTEGLDFEDSRFSFGVLWSSGCMVQGFRGCGIEWLRIEAVWPQGERFGAYPCLENC